MGSVRASLPRDLQLALAAEVNLEVVAPLHDPGHGQAVERCEKNDFRRVRGPWRIWPDGEVAVQIQPALSRSRRSAIAEREEGPGLAFTDLDYERPD